MLTLRQRLETLKSRISARSTYSGSKVPQSVMDKFEVEIRNNGGGILVPFWIPILEKGRGPRKTNKDHGLVYKIYAWMQKKSMFRSVTKEGQFSEAKSMTWYINKYGNKHFRSKTFIDIYTTETKRAVEEISKDFADHAYKMTSDIL